MEFLRRLVLEDEHADHRGTDYVAKAELVGRAEGKIFFLDLHLRELKNYQ
jgi:hypothetical protein